MRMSNYQLITVSLEDQQREEFTISPDAQDKIRDDLNQAMAKNTIADDRERSIAECALLAVAIEMAHEEGTTLVKAAHVSRGWQESLSIGPGCDPPAECLRRSVIERVDEIKARSFVFREMMSEIE